MATEAKHTRENGGSAAVWRKWADDLANALDKLSNDADAQFTEHDLLLAEYRGFCAGVEVQQEAS